jgi:hypothetical protein
VHHACGCSIISSYLLATKIPAPRTPQLLHYQQTVPPLPNPAHFSNITRFADPGYYEGDPEEEGAPDPLTTCLPNKESYQHIRALPAQPGAALLFTHRCARGLSKVPVSALVCRDVWHAKSSFRWRLVWCQGSAGSDAVVWESYQRIRALTAQSGAALLFTHTQVGRRGLAGC